MNKNLRIVLILAAVVIIASGLLLTGFVAGRLSARIGNQVAANAWQAGGADVPFWMGRMMGGGIFSGMGRMMGGAQPGSDYGACPFFNQDNSGGFRMGPGMMNPDGWTR